MIILTIRTVDPEQQNRPSKESISKRWRSAIFFCLKGGGGGG